MVITGRTGADAVFIALRHICGTLKRYRVKLTAVVTSAQTANVITEEQAVLINDFLGTVELLCAAMELVAGYSGFG